MLITMMASLQLARHCFEYLLNYKSTFLGEKESYSLPHARCLQCLLSAKRKTLS